MPQFRILPFSGNRLIKSWMTALGNALCELRPSRMPRFSFVAATVYGAALAPGYAGLFQIAIQIPPSLKSGEYQIYLLCSPLHHRYGPASSFATTTRPVPHSPNPAHIGDQIPESCRDFQGLNLLRKCGSYRSAMVTPG
jgi:hypothetical protein